MARIYLRRTLTGFVAADEASQEVTRKYKVGEVYRADVVKPRSYQHHKQVMALLDLTYSNLHARYLKLWPTPRAFRRGLAEAVGYTESYATVEGEIREVGLSLSYDDLPDEVEFGTTASLMMGVCANLLGVDEPQLAAEVAQHAMYGAAA
jgi:hypothetical protein